MCRSIVRPPAYFYEDTERAAPGYHNMMSRRLSLFLLAFLGVVNIWIDNAFVQDIRKVFEKRPPLFSHYSTRPGHPTMGA